MAIEQARANRGLRRRAGVCSPCEPGRLDGARGTPPVAIQVEIHTDLPELQGRPLWPPQATLVRLPDILTGVPRASGIRLRIRRSHAQIKLLHSLDQ